MALAAQELLDLLEGDQRVRALGPFPGDEDRLRWFYTPTDHGGLPLAAMTARQEGAALRLLASGLSSGAFATVSTIMGLENALDHREGFRQNVAGRERGRDASMYFVRIFGAPEAHGTWAWRFGGHHVSINNLVVAGRAVSSTPCFLGATPADLPLLGGHFLRPLGALEDLARELVHSLDEEQRHHAVISPAPPLDVVSGNRARVSVGDGPLTLAELFRDTFSSERAAALVARTRAEEAEVGFGAAELEAVRIGHGPAGISVARFSPANQELFRRLLDTYIGRVPDEMAEVETAKYAGARIESLHFAWAGGIHKGQPHYYRITGPRLLAEYDNAQNRVDHIHTVWRDPTGDFGFDVLGAHLHHDH